MAFLQDHRGYFHGLFDWIFSIPESDTETWLPVRSQQDTPFVDKRGTHFEDYDADTFYCHDCQKFISKNIEPFSSAKYHLCAIMDERELAQIHLHLQQKAIRDQLDAPRLRAEREAAAKYWYNCNGTLYKTHDERTFYCPHCNEHIRKEVFSHLCEEQRPGIYR